MIKDRKLLFMIFTIACFIAIGVCYIVDNAINQEITWSAYPLLSVTFGWLVVSPLFIKKHGAALSLCALTIFVIPFLYYMDIITPVDSWFSPLGLPSAIVGVITSWVIYALFRFIKISPWYKAAISVLLLGAVVSPVINHVMDKFEKAEPLFNNNLINIFACVTAAAVIGIIGYTRNKAKRAVNKK